MNNYIVCPICEEEQCYCELCELCSYQSNIQDEFDEYSDGDYISETYCKSCVSGLK